MSNSDKDFGEKVLDFINANRDATAEKFTGLYLVAHNDDGCQQIVHMLTAADIYVTEKLIEHTARNAASKSLGLD